jgi:hypothetical protein
MPQTCGKTLRQNDDAEVLALRAEVERLRAGLARIADMLRPETWGPAVAVVRVREVERIARELAGGAAPAAGEAERLRGALAKLEWSFRQTSLRNGGTIYTATLCPACMGEKDPPDDKGSRRRRDDPLPPAGHKPDCWLARALAGGEG